MCAHREDLHVARDQLSGELYHGRVHGELLEQRDHKDHRQVMSRHAVHLTVHLHPESRWRRAGRENRINVK